MTVSDVLDLASLTSDVMTRAVSVKLVSAILVTVVLSCQSSQLIAQKSPAKQTDQDDVIRVKTDLVQLRAVVTDKNGQLVDNLKQDDFEVLENGQPQSVGFFSLERIQKGSSSPVASDRKSVAVPDQPGPSHVSAKPVRTIVLFVDTLHLSSVSFLRAKQQLKRFVDEQITDEDLVGIVTTSDSLGVLGQFMRDRKMLKYAIDKIPLFIRSASFYTPYLAARVLSSGYSPFGTGAASEALSVATAIMAKEEYGGAMAPPPGVVLARARQILEEESIRRRATLVTIKAVSDRMAEMRGQRMIAFMSDGFTLLDENGAEHQEFVTATSHAVRSGVLIYSFSPQGLTTPVEFTAAAPIMSPSFGRLMHDSQVDQEQTLKDLAYDTGGEAHLYSNDIGAQFQKMLDSNSLYYAIAYYPHDETDNKFRNLKVRVKNHPEYHVRTQRGYQLSKESKQEAATTPQQKLFQAMVAPLPVTTLGVRSAASFLERADDDATVTLQVHFDGHLLEYAQRDQKSELNCEVAVAVIDRSGKISNSVGETIKAVFTPEQLEKAKQKGYRYSKRLGLAPGLYQIRVGVRDVNGQQMGTSSSWVSVPDLRNKKLTLSSLFLGRESREEQAQIIATGNKSSSRPMLVLGPASFKTRDNIFYRFVLYNGSNDIRATSNFMLKVEVLESGALIYEGPWQSVAPRVIRSDGIGTEIGGQIKIEMAPGVYILRVTVRDEKSNATTQQTIELEIEA